MKPPALNEACRAFILRSEGIDQPGKWPGGGSGITLGHGFDLGYCTRGEFTAAWGKHLTPDAMRRLSKAIGFKAASAKAAAAHFTGIRVTPEQAREVFARCTEPKWTAAAVATFPGCEKLPADAYGALVSLVFNRGQSLKGPRRREMAQILKHVAEWSAGGLPLREALERIAESLRSMKRLWPDLPGLITRREGEARLVERSLA